MDARIGEAESVVRSQRGENVGGDTVVHWDDVTHIGDSYVGGIDLVDADDYRDLAFELHRLQRAVMGEPEPAA